MKKNARLILLITGITFFSPLFSRGQDTRNPPGKNMELNEETLGDAYLPNEYDNKRTSAGYKYRSTNPSRSVGSSIFTIQVNVDSLGQNILFDAANEPNIAINPLNPNQIVIGWRQFDNVTSNFRQAGWSFTTDAGQSWTFPGVIDPGNFHSDPVLDYDESGNFFYNSLAYSFTCKVHKSSNGGATWNSGTNAGGGDKQWMAIDRTNGVGNGKIYSFWSSSYSTCPPGFFTRSSNGNTSYESCTYVNGDPYFGTMVVGNAGELYIAGADKTSNNIVVAKSVNARTTGSAISWKAPVKVFMDGAIGGANINPAGLLGQANIAVDPTSSANADNVYVLASVERLSNSDPGDVMFAKSTDGGLTWSSPIRINDDPSANNTQWLGCMSVAPNGRIDAVWLDSRDDMTGGDMSALYYSYSTDKGLTWSANEKLSDSFNPHIGYPNQNKMGDYLDMVSDNSGAHLAWACTLNGEEDVYYSRILPPIITGINEIANIPEFFIFPNPTKGEFVINGEVKQSRIEIYNVLGEKVYSVIKFKGKSEIDISTQPAGIYFLKIIKQDECVSVKKLIKD